MVSAPSPLLLAPLMTLLLLRIALHNMRDQRKARRLNSLLLAGFGAAAG